MSRRFLPSRWTISFFHISFFSPMTSFRSFISYHSELSLAFIPVRDLPFHPQVFCVLSWLPTDSISFVCGFRFDALVLHITAGSLTLFSSFLFQGATIKRNEITGEIFVARVIHGGLADRSGEFLLLRIMFVVFNHLYITALYH